MLGNRTPQFAEDNPNSPYLVRQNMKYLSRFKRKKPKFKVGEEVRIKKIKGAFEKEYDGTFKDEIFKIIDVKLNLPIPLYEVASLSGEPLDGKFYASQLTRVNQEVHRIEKIIKKRGNKSLVQWQGYTKKDNTWLDNSEIIRLTQ